MTRKYDRYIKLKEQNYRNHSKDFEIDLFRSSIKIDGYVLNTDYTKNLDLNARKELSPKIIDYFCNLGFVYPYDCSTFLNDFNNCLCAVIR